MASSPLDSYPTRSDVAANPLLLDQLLAPANALLDGYIRDVRTEGVITDPDFVRLGILRILSQAVSGKTLMEASSAPRRLASLSGARPSSTRCIRPGVRLC